MKFPKFPKRSNTAEESARGRRKRLEREAKANAPTGDTCREHPEFNRLAYVFRESLKANNLHAARQAFMQMDSLQIAMGLSDESLLCYSHELGNGGLWVDAIRPLVVVGSKKGPRSDDAHLSLAKIQLETLKRSDLATATLNQIQTPETGPVDAAQKARLKARDEMLQACKKG